MLIDDLSVQLLKSPFQCCTLQNFISSKSYPKTDSSSNAESNLLESCSRGAKLFATTNTEVNSNVTNSGTNSSVISEFGSDLSSVADSESSVDQGEPSIRSDETGVFRKELESELLKLKFFEKNNDLYQFHQVRMLIYNILQYPPPFQCSPVSRHSIQFVVFFYLFGLVVFLLVLIGNDS